MFKNLRDNNQIDVLARQMFSGNTTFKTMFYTPKKPYGYILIAYKAKNTGLISERICFQSFWLFCPEKELKL